MQVNSIIPNSRAYLFGKLLPQLFLNIIELFIYVELAYDKFLIDDTQFSIFICWSLPDIVVVIFFQLNLLYVVRLNSWSIQCKQTEIRIEAFVLDQISVGC